jgi:hypothetical protein
LLAAHHIHKIGAHLVTALARLHVENLAQISSLEAGSTRDERAGRSEKRVKLRVIVCYGKREIQVAHSLVSQTGT